MLKTYYETIAELVMNNLHSAYTWMFDLLQENCLEKPAAGTIVL